MRSTIGNGRPSRSAIKPHFMLPARRMALRIINELLLVVRWMEFTARKLSSARGRAGRRIECKAHATCEGRSARALTVSRPCLSVPAEDAGESLFKGDGRLVAEVAAGATDVGP